jgi:hypothetical protein
VVVLDQPLERELLPKETKHMLLEALINEMFTRIQFILKEEGQNQNSWHFLSGMLSPCP